MGNALKFKEEKYDLKNNGVVDTLNKNIRCVGSKCSCRSCHRYLLCSDPKVPLHTPTKVLTYQQILQEESLVEVNVPYVNLLIEKDIQNL